MIKTYTENEFDSKFPNWLEADEKGKYRNLPQEAYVIITCEGKYLTVDNRDFCCWVDEFSTKEEAVDYLE